VASVHLSFLKIWICLYFNYYFRTLIRHCKVRNKSYRKTIYLSTGWLQWMWNTWWNCAEIQTIRCAGWWSIWDVCSLDKSDTQCDRLLHMRYTFANQQTLHLQHGTSAGFWLGGQCPLAARGEENFENLTTKWCILKYIWINMWSA